VQIINESSRPYNWLLFQQIVGSLRLFPRWIYCWLCDLDRTKKIKVFWCLI